jgi:hypothetical protein
MYVILYQRKGKAQQAFGPYAEFRDANNDLVRLPPKQVCNYKYVVYLDTIKDADCVWELADAKGKGSTNG